MYNKDIIEFIKHLYNNKEFIPLHAPVFLGNEKKYLLECIDSTFVSSVGKFVDKFERDIEDFTNANKAVAVVNGTSALHTALEILNVKSGDEVLTQPLTFIATCNAISYQNAVPVFIDVDIDTLGMSPNALEVFLKENAIVKDKQCYNIKTGAKISACVPMHTFGLPLRITQIVDLCDRYHIPVIEDSAESIGSYFNDKHTGTFGKVGIYSFNGNKTITSGGGGVLVTNDIELGKLAKHITTTAKVAHKWEFNHDRVGYNYRMPNINAALACAQLEMLPKILNIKRNLSSKYQNYFEQYSDIKYINEIGGAESNYWLNTIIFNKKEKRNNFLKETNDNGVMTRPAWNLMSDLTMYRHCYSQNLENSIWLSERVVNIPSGVN